MISTKDIVIKYNLKILGNHRNVLSFSSLQNQHEGGLIWVKSEELLSSIEKGIALIPKEYKGKIFPSNDLTILFCNKSPRLIFARILNDFFSDKKLNDFENCIEKHKLNAKIKIGDNCFIGKNVEIGDGTEILHNTSIFSNTIIGKNCHINTSCSIGTPGLGFEYDGDELVRFPQFGGVIIGDNVEVGPNSTIRRGALDNTIVGNGCKIGALSNIGHNCILGKNSILTCQIVLGGSTKLGNNVFMGINSATKNKVIIGSNVVVGMGAVVIKDVPDNVTLIGIPAKIVDVK
jgi:UDP-3-O-[3-hydroxymyristoyl] glucosamine N-acyltransferase